MLFFAYLVGFLGLLVCGLSFLGALFMFPTVECLVLLLGGVCLTFASFCVIDFLEV